MEVGDILLDILVVLVAAKVAAEVAERLRFPAVVAEIVAGILVGPSVLDLVETNEVLAVLGELGVILLLLQVGLEMNLSELGAVGRASLMVAVVGVVVPMAGGMGVGALVGEDGNTAVFLGASLAATSVGITARVFSDLRALASVEARTVLGAAVADDVLGLVILTVVVRVVTEGSVSVLSVAEIIGVAVAFLAVTSFVGVRFGPWFFQVVQSRARAAGTLVAVALAFTLAFAELADAAQLAPIVGAFVAGVALAGSQPAERITRELTPVGHLFIPVFFLTIGIDIDVGAFFRPEVIGIGAGLLVVAVLGKLVAGYAAIGSPGDKLLMGFGMLPRGEVGLIFAAIGLEEGILDDNLYAALILVVLLTTLAAPPLLRLRLLRGRARPREPVSETPPPGGWLARDADSVDLAARPPDRLALAVGLDAALAMRDARPGSHLLDWLGGLGAEPIRWDRDATRRLLRLLRDGSVRSWRFLEVTGLLERALPELADAVRRRRADPFVIDPAHILRFELVEALGELVEGDEPATAVHAALEHPEWLLLAALILDAAGEDTAPVELARLLVKRLDLGAAAEQEVALLVGDSALMRGAIRRVDGLEEEPVVQLAMHLERPERARALYLLSLALGTLEPPDRARLDDLLELVLTVMDRPDLVGRDAANLVEGRRAQAQALLDGDHAAERVRSAPRVFVLTQQAADVARAARLLQSLPARAAVRVTVEAVEPDRWRVDVAARDRPGLMATVSGVLAACGLDVEDAVAATWDDGGAFESFRVRRAELDPPQLDRARVDAPTVPVPDDLEAAIAKAIGTALSSPPNPDAVVTFDDAASPWHTICEVRSPDRRGLLHTITVALVAAGANIHSARLVTEGGLAVDRFELTDVHGLKLDDTIKGAFRRALAEGVVAPRKRRILSR